MSLNIGSKFLSQARLSVRSVVAAYLMTMSCVAYSADLIWVGDFETGDFSQFNNHLYGEEQYSTKRITSSRSRSGQFATELTILGYARPGRERAELITKRGDTGGAMRFQWDGPEYWVGFSFLFDEWNAAGWTFFQVHSPDGDPSASCHMGGNAFGVYPAGADENGGIANQLAVRVIEQGGTAKSSAGSNTVNVYSSPLTLNEWHDYVVRLKLSATGQGFFEVWKDGQKVYSKFNLTNVDFRNGCGETITETSHYGAQIGIYGGNEPTFRRIYYDEVRIAEGADGFNMVSPGNGLAKATTKPKPPNGLSFE